VHSGQTHSLTSHAMQQIALTCITLQQWGNAPDCIYTAKPHASKLQILAYFSMVSKILHNVQWTPGKAPQD